MKDKIKGKTVIVTDANGGIGRPWPNIAISPDSIAHAVAYAISQPEDFDVNEIILRPIKQPV